MVAVTTMLFVQMREEREQVSETRPSEREREMRTLKCIRINAEIVKMQRIDPRLKAEFPLPRIRVLIRKSAHQPKVGVPPWRIVVLIRVPPFIQRRLRARRSIIQFGTCFRLLGLWHLFAGTWQTPREYRLEIDKREFLSGAAYCKAR